MRVVDGTMFASPEAIHEGAVDYFSGFLQADSSRDLPNLSYLISPVISDKDNGSIVCTQSMEKSLLLFHLFLQIVLQALMALVWVFLRAIR